jgi:hypothetical protein
MKKRVIVIECINALIILLFVYAALNKLLDFENFKNQLSKSPVLKPFVLITAYSVPAAELVLALMLCFKKYEYFGLYFSFFIMSLFTSYIYVILKVSKYIPCSCGGILETLTWKQHLFFNIGFVILIATAILIYPRNSKNFLQKEGKLKT